MCTQSSRGTAAALVILAMFLCRICSAEKQPGSSRGPVLETCNITADGREFTCRGAGFLSILEPLDAGVLPSTVNLTKLDHQSTN